MLDPRIGLRNRNVQTGSSRHAGQLDPLRVASMFLPCFSLTIFGVEKWIPGVFGFIAGLTDPLDPNKPPNVGVHFASWLANPLFWAGLYLLIAHKSKWSMFAGLTSCVLAVLAVCSLWDKIAGWPAFWTWLAGFATLAIGSLVSMHAYDESRPEPDSDAMPGNPTDERITASSASRSGV